MASRILRAINTGASDNRIGYRTALEWERHAKDLLGELKDSLDEARSLFRLTAAKRNEIRVKYDGAEDRTGDDPDAVQPLVRDSYQKLNISASDKKLLKSQLAVYRKLREFERRWAGSQAGLFDLQISLREAGNDKQADDTEKEAKKLDKLRSKFVKRLEKTIFSYVETLQALPSDFEQFMDNLVDGLEQVLTERDGKTRFFDKLEKFQLVDVDFYDDEHEEGEVARFTVYLRFENPRDPVERSRRLDQVYLVVQQLVVLGDNKKGSRKTGITSAYKMLPPEEAQRGWVVLNNSTLTGAVEIALTLLQRAVAPNLLSYYGIDVDSLLNKRSLTNMAPGNLRYSEFESSTMTKEGRGILRYSLKDEDIGLSEARYEVLEAMSSTGLMETFLVYDRLNPDAKYPLIFELEVRRDPAALTYESYYKMLELLHIDEDSPEEETFWSWLEEQDVDLSTWQQ